MFAAVLSLSAMASDPSGARPGAGAPELTSVPLAELRVGAEIEPASTATFGVAARGGLEVERKVLKARLSLQASKVWGLDAEPAMGSIGAEIGEAWLSWSPPISSALGITTTAGVQRVEFDDGLLIGADDRRGNARFPLAGRATLRASPWVLDGLVGLASGPAPVAAGPEVLPRTPFAAGRLAVGRDNPVWRWEVAATALRLYDDGESGSFTGGVVATAGLNRVRLDTGALLQDGSSHPGLLARGRAGFAMGDESRVVLWAGVLARGTEENPGFTRPLGTTDTYAGWLGLLKREGVLRDAFLDLDATLAPSLRFTTEAHHFWVDGVALGPELDVDLTWYWSPLAALRLRGSALTPWSSAQPVELAGALTFEASVH